MRFYQSFHSFQNDRYRAVVCALTGIFSGFVMELRTTNGRSCYAVTLKTLRFEQSASSIKFETIVYGGGSSPAALLA